MILQSHRETSDKLHTQASERFKSFDLVIKKFLGANEKRHQEKHLQNSPFYIILQCNPVTPVRTLIITDISWLGSLPVMIMSQTLTCLCNKFITCLMTTLQ